jgi:hypothetical protein
MDSFTIPGIQNEGENLSPSSTVKNLKFVAPFYNLEISKVRRSSRQLLMDAIGLWSLLLCHALKISMKLACYPKVGFEIALELSLKRHYAALYCYSPSEAGFAQLFVC